MGSAVGVGALFCILRTFNRDLDRKSKIPVQLVRIESSSDKILVMGTVGDFRVKSENTLEFRCRCVWMSRQAGVWAVHVGFSGTPENTEY